MRRGADWPERARAAPRAGAPAKARAAMKGDAVKPGKDHRAPREPRQSRQKQKRECQGQGAPCHQFAPGMAHGGAHHHRHGHATDRSDPEQMRRRRHRGQPEGRRTDGDETGGDAEIGQVQHAEERRAPCNVPAPAREPRHMQEGRQRAQHGRREGEGREDPSQKRTRTSHEREPVEAVERHRKPGRAALRQPVAGEAGQDAPADQHDQEDQQRQTQPPPQIGGAKAHDFCVIKQIGGPEQGDGQQDLEVAPVPARHDLARDHGDHGQKKALVDQQHHGRRQGRAPGQRQASAQPEHQQSRKRPATRRHAACPVGHGGK